MIDSDFNSDSTSSSPVVSANSPVVDNIGERRTKSHHDYRTFGKTKEELTVRAFVLVYGQYGTVVGLAECSPLLFPPGEPLSSRPAQAPKEGGRQRYKTRCHPLTQTK